MARSEPAGGIDRARLRAEHRRRRTNNGLERLKREIKRRTHAASIFPNEASLVRLATAVLMETDECVANRETLPSQGNRVTHPDPDYLQKNGCTIWRCARPVGGVHDRAQARRCDA